MNRPNNINSPKRKTFLTKLEHNKKAIWLTILLALAGGYALHELTEKETFKAKVETPASLKWRKINDLYSYYMWFSWKRETLWDSINFNPEEIIHQLYEKKLKNNHRNDFVVAQKFYDEVIKKIDFNTVDPSDIDTYLSHIEKAIDEVKDNFNWEKFGKDKFQSNTNKTSLFKHICKNIDEESLLSYSMTELFPWTEWIFNKEFLSFILEHGGEKFLQYLPAIYDDYTSFWPYQFTYLALADYGKTKNWASQTNIYLPEHYRIPGSVNQLKWDQHHKAAYLFAMYNIAQLVKRNDIPQGALSMISKGKYKNDLAELIAIMHNKPGKWADFLKEWYRLQNNQTYDKNKNGKVDIYEAYPWSKIASQYGKKTYHNKNAIN